MQVNLLCAVVLLVILLVILGPCIRTRRRRGPS